MHISKRRIRSFNGASIPIAMVPYADSLVSWMTRSTGYSFAYGFPRIHQIRSTEVGFSNACTLVPTHAVTWRRFLRETRVWYFRSLTKIDRQDRDQSYALPDLAPTWPEIDDEFAEQFPYLDVTFLFSEISTSHTVDDRAMK